MLRCRVIGEVDPVGGGISERERMVSRRRWVDGRREPWRDGDNEMGRAVCYLELWSTCTWQYMVGEAGCSGVHARTQNSGV